MTAHDEAGHVCGPDNGCVNPSYSVTMGPFPGYAPPRLALVVLEDKDSPSGYSSLAQGNVADEDLPGLLRSVANAYEARYRASLS